MSLKPPPPPAFVAKGCLDECDVCDPAQQAHIKLALEHAKLKNLLLVKKIQFLEKSQEHRCCAVEENEKGEAA